MNGLRRIAHRMTAVIMLASFGVLLIGATPAEAETVQPIGSYPGSASVPTVIVEQPYSSCGPDCIPMDDAGHFTNQARTVYESPRFGSSWQRVCVTHRLWRYDPPYVFDHSQFPGSFTLDKSSSTCRWISPSATSIRDLGKRFDLLYSHNDWGKYFRVDVVVKWRLSDGTALGTKVYRYVHRTDYFCATFCTTFFYAEDGGITVMV